MNNNLLISLMVVTIIIVKAFWIWTEIKYFKNRVNFEMFKTNFIEAVILILQILAVYIYPLPTTDFDRIIVGMGIVMFILGIILAVWARLTMNRVWGVPGEHAAQQDALITTGPFKFSRNPIYLGFLLIYFGFAIAIKSWLIILRIPLLIYFYKSAKIEEKLLMERFGEKYKRYKTKVPLIF